MIARNGQHRRAQFVGEGLGRAKFSWQRALCDVAGQHHRVGLLLLCEGQQGFDHLRPFGAEMRVGNVQHRTHAAASLVTERTLWSVGSAAPANFKRYKGRGSTLRSIGARRRATSPSNATTTSLRPEAIRGVTTK